MSVNEFPTVGSETKPRVAWFATSKPHTLSRYATQTYLPQLTKYFEIINFVGDSQEYGTPHGVAYEMHKDHPFDVFVYCLERDTTSDFAWAGLGVFPGIVLLLEDFAPPEKPWLFQSSFEETVGLLKDGSSLGLRSLVDKEPFPVDAEIRAATLATMLIVGSEEMLERIPQKFHAKCSVIPLPVESELWKATQNFPRQIAVCTPATEDYLLSKIFVTIKNFLQPISLVWLTDTAVDEANVRRKEQEFLNGTKSTVTIAAKTPENWKALIKTSDAAFHLQGWGRASLEPYLGLSLMSGIPTVVTNFGVGRLLSENLAIKISIGLSSSVQLAAVLFELFASSEWSTERQAVLASSRYDLFQNSGELISVMQKAVFNSSRQGLRLSLEQKKVRQRWIEHAIEDIAGHEMGESFAEAKTFLKGLSNG